MKRLVQILLVLLLNISFYGYVNNYDICAEVQTQTQISCQEDLEMIRNNPSGSYILISDITLQGEFNPIAAFSGVLDGNGHIINNLTIHASSSNPKVAFIVTNNGTIKNLGFSNANITGLSTDSSYWASVIATKNNGIISECYVDGGTVSGAYRSAGICVTNTSEITNCYSSANVSAYSEAGGIVGVNERNAIIDSSIASGTIYSQSRNTGGISAYGYTGSTISNCAFISGSINNVKTENGGRIIGRLNGSPTLTNNIANSDTTVFGQTVTGTLADKNGLDESSTYLNKAGIYSGLLDLDFSNVWGFDLTNNIPKLRKFIRCTGTTYQIYDSDDLEYIRNYGSISNNEFILMNDIIVDDNFSPIITFNATLNGNGHNISGFDFVSTDTQVSAFIQTNNGTIKNLGLTSLVVHGINTNDSCYAAGLIGINNGVIEKCYVTGNISGGYRSGGIAAHNRNLIVDCYFVGYVSALAESGGICAVAEATSGVKNCYSQATVYSTNNNTGGISAYAYTGTYINDCVTLSGHIDNGGGSNISRVVGRLRGTPSLDNNYASENALVQTLPITCSDATNKEGKTVENENITSSLFENTLGWDLDTVWNYNSSSGINRPTLSGFDEELSERFIYSITSTISGNVSDGLTYSVVNFTDTNFNSQSMSIIKLDYAHYNNYEVIVGTKDDAQPPTDENGNYIRTVDDDDHDVFKGIVPLQMSSTSTSRNKTVYAGVNGEFYTNEGPEGYMIKDSVKVVNGTRISSTTKQYPFHGFFGVRNTSNTNNLFIIGTYDDDWSSEYLDLKQATGGQYILTKNGDIPYYGDLIECVSDQTNYDQETYYRYKARHPRTAIGYDDNYLYMVVVDGRQTNATGVYIEELALIMNYLGCTNSINMDGGGSSTSVIRNSEDGSYDVLNSPSNAASKGIEYEGKYLRSLLSSVIIVDKNN